MIKRFKTLLKIMKTDGYRVQNIFYRMNYIYSILFPKHHEKGRDRRRKKYPNY